MYERNYYRDRSFTTFKWFSNYSNLFSALNTNSQIQTGPKTPNPPAFYTNVPYSKSKKDGFEND